MTKQERDKIIEDNMGLVYTISSKYNKLNSNIDFDDIVQEGTIGLIKSVDKFDETKDVKFSTFAYQYIDFFIQNFISKQNEVTLPKKIRKLINKINYIETIETNRLGYEPFYEDIANQLDITLEEYLKLKKIQKNINVVSTNSGIKGSENCILEDTLVDDTSDNEYNLIIQSIGNKQITDELLSCLTKRQQKTFNLYYFKGYTMDEIGKMSNTSRQNINCMIQNGIKRIRNTFNLDVCEVF